MHTPASCDDGIGCTVDSCVPQTGCVHEPDASLCPDQPYCNSAKVCDPKTGCGIDCTDGSICTTDQCDTTLDECVHTPANVPVSAADVGGSWDFTMACGTVANEGSFSCELNSAGELRMSYADNSGGTYVTSGCSDDGNSFCCFQ
jgi:hypothetical protein